MPGGALHSGVAFPALETAPALPPDLAERLERLALGARPDDPGGWAIRQGLAGIVDRLGAGSAWGPPERLRRHAELSALLWDVTLHHLRATTGALARAGIPSLVVKGALHALRHYPEPSLRPMADFDLLVPPDRWRDAASVVESLGWARFEAAEHAAAFSGPGGRLLELHGFLTSCPGLHPLAFSDLLARSVSLRPAADAAALADPDALVHAGLHIAFQHGLRARLGQYLDLERVLARPLDWDDVLAAARRARALRPLAASLAVLEALLEIGPPEPARRSLGLERPAAVQRFVDRHRNEPWRLLAGLPIARARWALAGSAACRIRLLALTLFPMHPDGRRRLGLGAALLRLARLARASLRPRRSDGC